MKTLPRYQSSRQSDAEEEVLFINHEKRLVFLENNHLFLYFFLEKEKTPSPEEPKESIQKDLSKQNSRAKSPLEEIGQIRRNYSFSNVVKQKLQQDLNCISSVKALRKNTFRGQNGKSVVDKNKNLCNYFDC